MNSRHHGLIRNSMHRGSDPSLCISWLQKLVSDHRHDLRLAFSRPGLRYGLSPAKPETTDTRSWFDRLFSQCLTLRGRRQYTPQRSSEWLNRIELNKTRLIALSQSKLDADRAALVQKMRVSSAMDDYLDDALVHALIAVERSCGLVARPNQCLAARGMLDGHFVEMATGEGKTLSVALAAGAAALSGTPIHVLTANDYLAERDASTMRAVYQYLGLSVSSIVTDQDPAIRREGYAADVAYVTAKQVAFDWLNDVQELGSAPDSLIARVSVLTQMDTGDAYVPMLRGLCLAIVDEADSLLIDEARIPLVLAAARHGRSSDDTEAIVALSLAEKLQESVDYNRLSTTRHIKLTDAGRSQLTALTQKVSHAWQSARFREERVEQALTVMYRFERDRDYIVRDGSLELMDAHTGRAMPDRRLPHGLHRLLEIKEQCTPSPEQETIATLPFQHFFRRYIELVGISGTLNEVAGEIHQVYNRFVVCVPPHRPCRRFDMPALTFQDRSSQLQAMVSDVQQRQKMDQPVLVCTRSVEQSLGVSAMLSAHAVEHQVLNAYQDANEASIVASAGKAGKVTVATNMAGRGTDIPVDKVVALSGGLHVISLAFNDAGRLDRQLAGRAARQGDSGSYQQFSSLDDPYLIEAMPELFRKCARIAVGRGWRPVPRQLIRWAQRRMERKHKHERVLLYQTREALESRLAFGGNPDYTS